MMNIRLAVGACIGVIGACAGVSLGQAGNNVQMQLRMVAQTGLPSESGGVVDQGGPAQITGPGQVRRFEIQYRVRLTGTGWSPTGLASAQLRIVAGGEAGNGVLDRAVLSRFESQTNTGATPPGPVDTSGISMVPLAPPNEARGLHRPYRAGLPGPLPNNSNAANGVISANGQTITSITPLVLSQPDEDAGGGPDGFGAYYGLYSFNYTSGSVLPAGVVTITASLDSDPMTGNRYSFYDNGNPVPITSPNGLDASIRIVTGPPGACCFVDGTCSPTAPDGCGGTFLGLSSACGPAVCPAAGACCTPANGCLTRTGASCVGAGGTWLGASTLCSANPCPPPYACCFPNFACLLAATQADCVSSGGQVRFTPTCAGAVCCPPVVITAQPQNAVFTAPQTVTFTVGAGSGVPLVYRWRRGGADLVNGGRISGATSATLTVTGAVAADVGLYDVVVTSSCGSSATSAAAALGACSGPTVTVQPASPVAVAGSTVMLTVGAAGAGNLLYRWQKNGTALMPSARITGVSGPVLTIGGLRPEDDGAYNALVLSECGQAGSGAALVTVSCAGSGASLDCNGNALCDALELGGLRDITAPSPADDDKFGWAVAIDGSRLMVGARTTDTARGLDAGAAYIYSNVGTGWVWDATLTAFDGAPLDEFGNRVAIQGQWAVVGARFATVNGVVGAGAAYIYRNIGAGWTFFQKLTEPAPTTYAEFGHGVDLDNDKVLIGALQGTGVQAGTGSAHVFRYNGVNWALETTLVAPDGASGEGFGISVAISDPYAVVGAPYGAPGAGAPGAAYLFFRSAGGWVMQSKVRARTPQPYETFGELVAIAGDVAVVNCPRETVGGLSYAGAVYTFRRTDTRWTQQRRLVAPTPQANELFGYDIAIESQTLVAGGFRRQVAGFTDAGAVDVFKRRGNFWTRADRIDSPKPETPSFFGYALAISGNRMAAGAFRGSARQVPDGGWVRVFDLSVLDCDNNGVPDLCDIAGGGAVDADGNGVPDGCQSATCFADFNDSGGVTVQDIFDFLIDYFAGNLTADFNDSGTVTVQDVFDFLIAYFGRCG